MRETEAQGRKGTQCPQGAITPGGPSPWTSSVSSVSSLRLHSPEARPHLGTRGAWTAPVKPSPSVRGQKRQTCLIKATQTFCGHLSPKMSFMALFGIGGNHKSSGKWQSDEPQEGEGCPEPGLEGGGPSDIPEPHRSTRPPAKGRTSIPGREGIMPFLFWQMRVSSPTPCSTPPPPPRAARSSPERRGTVCFSVCAQRFPYSNHVNAGHH